VIAVDIMPRNESSIRKSTGVKRSLCRETSLVSVNIQELNIHYAEKRV